MGEWHILHRYIEAFQSGFDEGLKDVQLSFMQSDGGLSPVSSFCGHKAVLSGPAGGCVGPLLHICLTLKASLPYIINLHPFLLRPQVLHMLSLGAGMWDTP